MASLARRNLFHDKLRLVVTLTGVVFAVVLIAIQIGLFVGFLTATSTIIDHSGADIWIVSKGVGYLEVGQDFSERKRYKALTIDGVQRVEKYIVRFTQWKLPNGSEEGIELIGFDTQSGLGGPWNIVEGDARDLDQADTVIVDRLYQEKLGVTHLGQTVEIGGYRARVVGFTYGIRTFTTSPAVFTSFKNAQNYGRIGEDRTTFLLVKLAPGADVDGVRDSIAGRIGSVDVFTRDEFSRKTAAYWLFGTGAGVTVLIAALLGLIVGVVVVAQTIYSATVDHIREFGTLKAMGATNLYIYQIIIKQALMSAVMGYAIGISGAYVAVFSSRDSGAAIILPWQIGIALFGVTVGMCVGAAFVSINKVTRIDPAMVFKG